MTSILALDTTSQQLSVSLLHQGEYWHFANWVGQKHTALLLLAVEQLLSQAQCRFSDLDALAVTHGPGSFTGVRIGLASAQGLALPHDMTLYPVSTLEAMAQAAHDEQPKARRVLCALDARMGELYSGAYSLENGQTPRLIGRMQLIAPEQCAIPEADPSEWCFTGAGFSAYPDVAARLQQAGAKALDLEAVASAKAVLSIAEARRQAGDRGVVPEAVEAVYLRNKVTG